MVVVVVVVVYVAIVVPVFGLEFVIVVLVIAFVFVSVLNVALLRPIFIVVIPAITMSLHNYQDYMDYMFCDCYS